jgi:hypothetical protein
MTQLGPITVTVSVSLGTTGLPVKPITFDVPLRTIEDGKLTDTSVTYTVNLDRTELRDHLTKSVRTLADQVEGAFLTPGAVVLTCDQCDAQIVSQTLATLRHERDGAHSLGVPAVASGGVITDGELFIPTEGSSRSKEILAETMRRMGVAPTGEGPAAADEDDA